MPWTAGASGTPRFVTGPLALAGAGAVAAAHVVA
jgi:hypothetical protein